MAESGGRPSRSGNPSAEAQHSSAPSSHPGEQSTGLIDESELASLPTAGRLERMSRALFRATNAQELDSSVLTTYLSATFRAADIDRFVPSSGSLTSYIESLRSMTDDGIMYRHDVLSTSVDVDEDRGEGTAWATLRVTGLPPYGRLVHESVSRLKWVYKGRQIGWVCTEHSGIRGGGGVDASR